MKPKTTIVNVRIATDEFESLKHTAKQLGIDLPEFMREQLRKLSGVKVCPTCGQKVTPAHLQDN